MHTWAILILLILATSVGARELPSEVDLRASYCIPIVQQLISLVKSSTLDVEDAEIQEAAEAMKEALAGLKADLRRLQLYLVPRIQHLDLIGLAAARKRGEEDWAKADEHGKICSAKCEHLLGKLSWTSCLDKCNANNPLKARMKACSDLSWLPF